MFFILACLAALLTASAQAQTADLIVENVHIYTLNPQQPKATMLAVKNGRILAVGDNLDKYSAPSTVHIEGNGHTVIPGLIDSHVHLQGLGDLLENLDLRAETSIDSIAAKVKAEAAKRGPGAWVRGRAWDQTNWGGVFPTAAPISAAAPQNPVFLTRVDGHAAWVNQKAMELAGINDKTPDPPGGKLIRDAQGHATGVLIDRAQALVASHIPKPTDKQVQDRLERAAQMCVKLGLTGVHDAGIDAQTLQAYRTLIAANRMPLRIYAMIGGEGALWQEFLKKGPEVNDRLTVRCIKLYADGAMGSRGAAFFQPYTDDPGNSGLLLTTEADIERVARAAVAHGFQVATHAIGDRANHVALEAYGKALGGDNDKRFRIEHAQIINLPDFDLFKQFHVIASVQTTHATSDMRWVEKRLGPDRLIGAYPWQRFLKAGIPLAEGSDFPVEDPNPLWGFYAGVTRQDKEGNPPGGWLPTQKLSRDEMLRAFTIGGAYAAFEEKSKGSLEPGKLADFVILGRDIMTVEPKEILTAPIIATYVGGKQVYGPE